MKAVLPAAAVAVGVVLLVASVAWSVMFPASQVWTDEKAGRMTALGNQATELRLQMEKAQARPSMHSGQNPAELQEQYDKVSEEYKALYEEFRSAKDKPESASKLLRWSGIAFVIAGGLVVFATRSA